MKTPTPDESKAGVAVEGDAIVHQGFMATQCFTAPRSALLPQLLTAVGAPLTMSSHEIAGLTGKEHRNVCRDIRAMLEGLGLDVLTFEQTAPDSRGRLQPVFHLPKDLCITLVAGYSVVMRHRIVSRWLELETRLQTAAPTLPRTFAEALRLAAAQAEQMEAQRQQLEQQRPAVEFVERYVAATGSLPPRQVAKLVNAPPRKFIAWLEERGIMYRLGGRLTPAARHMDAGRFEVKAGTANNGHAYTTARFTPAGVQWVAGEWGKRVGDVALRKAQQ